MLGLYGKKDIRVNPRLTGYVRKKGDWLGQYPIVYTVDGCCFYIWFNSLFCNTAWNYQIAIVTVGKQHCRCCCWFNCNGRSCVI